MKILHCLYRKKMEEKNGNFIFLSNPSSYGEIWMLTKRRNLIPSIPFPSNHLLSSLLSKQGDLHPSKSISFFFLFLPSKYDLKFQQMISLKASTMALKPLISLLFLSLTYQNLNSKVN